MSHTIYDVVCDIVYLFIQHVHFYVTSYTTPYKGKTTSNNTRRRLTCFKPAESAPTTRPHGEQDGRPAASALILVVSARAAVAGRLYARAEEDHACALRPATPPPPLLPQHTEIFWVSLQSWVETNRFSSFSGKSRKGYLFLDVSSRY